MSTNPRARAWVEIRPDALRANLARVRASVGPAPGLIPMVKADGYGLGVAAVVEALEPAQPSGYGVAAVAEGVHLRALGVRRPVVVFSPAPPGELAEAVGAELTLTISDVATLAPLAEAARSAGRTTDFQIEIDTGMGRAGLDWRAVGGWGPALGALPESLRWTGCYTHLHSADEGEPTVREQWERLQTALAALPTPESGLLVHALNSAGALRCPELAAGAVRPGIFLYGGSAGAGLPTPAAVASVHARVTHVRDAPAGTTVGYGATHAAARDARWATLAIGYGDGWPRALGNRGSALLSGRRVPVIGRISMDVTVVDITGVPGVSVGDVATLIGSDGEEEITVDEIAGLAGTISYEVLTGLTPRLPRVRLGPDHGSTHPHEAHGRGAA